MNALCLHGFRNWVFRLSKYHTVMVILFIHAQFIGGITSLLVGAHVCHFFLLLAFFFNWESLHAKLNNNYKARSEKKKKKKMKKMDETYALPHRKCINYQIINRCEYEPLHELMCVKSVKLLYDRNMIEI